MMTQVMLLVALLLPALAWGAGLTVIGGLTRQATVKPGGGTEGRVLLRNTSDEPIEVKAFITDYLFYADGRNLYGDPGSHPRSSAAWVSVTPKQFSIAPGATESVYYTIRVPENLALTGTYWAMLMIEPIARGALEPPAPEAGKVKVGVQTLMRYGIQLITSIGDTGAASLKFAERTLQVAKDQRVLLLDIENTGERVLNPLVWTELFDSAGASLGRFEAGRLRLYPTCSGRFRIDLSQLPAGAYSALVVADNGDDHVFGAQIKLDLP